MNYGRALVVLGLGAASIFCAGKPVPYDVNLTYKKGDITVTHIKGMTGAYPTGYRVEGMAETDAGSLRFSATEKTIRLVCPSPVGGDRETRISAPDYTPIGDCPKPNVRALRSKISEAVRAAAEDAVKK
jgi:hypothetical protein